MRLRSTFLALCLALGAGLPANANLIIKPTFDSSITGNINATQIQDTINQAIAFFEANYTNPITVTIDFQSMSSGLGESQVGFVYNVNYQTYYNALVATNANPAAIAGLTANNGSTANNPVTGTTIINADSADLRAVGLAGASLCNVIGTAGNLTCSATPGAGAIDGIIGLNTSITSPPGAESGDYDLLAVTEHEIDEVLGLGSQDAGCNSGAGCTGRNPLNPAPEDLFSYTAKGVRASLNVNCAALTQAYFSYSGAANITDLNTACNGGDFGDWKGVNGDPQVQDAYATPSQLVPYGSSELAAMSAIGYTLAPAPEPATWMLLLSSAGVLAIARRRMSRR
jgi:hypothetical protein